VGRGGEKIREEREDEERRKEGVYPCYHHHNTTNADHALHALARAQSREERKY
jgi:hypothetical protein